MARDEGKNVKASSTGANAGTLPNNDENRTPRQLVGRPEKSRSNKGDWLGKIAVVRDVVRCSDDVEGESGQPATENGKRKRQCGACRRHDPATYAARLRAHAPHTPVWVHGFSAVPPHVRSLKRSFKKD